MFEVQDLKYATLATVSRCGMVWFSEDVLATEMIFENFLMRLKNVSVEESDEDASVYSQHVSMSQSTASGQSGSGTGSGDAQEEEISPVLQVCRLHVCRTS